MARSSRAMTEWADGSVAMMVGITSIRLDLTHQIRHSGEGATGRHAESTT